MTGWIARHQVPRELRSYRLTEAIAAIDSCVAAGAGLERDDSEPIFVLSAGWRSGSTWVQRLLSSDGGTLVWGEPFGEAVPIPRLAAMLEAFTKKAPRRAADAYHAVMAQGEGPLAECWIANLNPGFAALRSAHKTFVDRMLAQPAKEEGFARWGAKWVRLSADHAHYLRWLYPRSRLVFLVRDPVDAWRSYKGRRWYTVNPLARVKSARAFAAHWRFLADSFLAHHRALDALLIRYEDLADSPEVRQRLARHCGVELEEGALERRLRGPAEGGRVVWRERTCIAAVTRGARRKLGYPIARPRPV